ncbi:hypothetical protein A9264_13195 [Vibrio sp. UCD-FRSSP16_10]|uniref:DUF4136 domain-containing protein n=1 Tax=unclassified Vibrio TaxID=2614977 RepID=UPI00080136F0|nr:MULTISPECIES: DUF4136 domain-containing protein [unclassified Vibrio]OBT15506.1 hypothetical protein A9260_13410 [Vibrio sp. UCD-FRSSP16_30]OBT20579.1 hypothetical protein A9264_13195 [Vibrio sp. UCD-FRSSP16_10]
MKWLFAVAFAVVLSACTTTPPPANNFAIGIVTSGDYRFIGPGTKTYAWHPRSGKAYVAEEMNEGNIRHVFNDAISQSLAEKGYIRVPLQQQPDFVIGYGVALESALNDDQLFDKIQLSTGIPASDFNNSDEKGSIVIAMYTYPLLELKWHSLAQGGADPKHDPEKNKQKIKSYVDSMLKDMPVSP